MYERLFTIILLTVAELKLHNTIFLPMSQLPLLHIDAAIAGNGIARFAPTDKQVSKRFTWNI